MGSASFRAFDWLWMIKEFFSSSLFTVFKDLLSKMLNPTRQLRIKIEQLEKHRWILGVFVEEFPPVCEKWKQESFHKLAKRYDLTLAKVTDEIADRPFGPLGGIYNIEKRSHQLNKIALKKASSSVRIVKVINHINSIDPSQISTLLTGRFIEQIISNGSPNNSGGKQFHAFNECSAETKNCTRHGSAEAQTFRRPVTWWSSLVINCASRWESFDTKF